MSRRSAKRLKAATLAVGTEVVDGQITDRNSAWISDRCASAGLEVIEHRVVPDDRAMISRALEQLSDKVDLLFVTGGLGPTSDDFTRDLISEVYRSPLEFNEASWQKIVRRFEARGAVASPIQRQQCFFPRSAAILDNPVGTANAFSMPVVWNDRHVFVVVLPGPPAEIAAVWDSHLEAKLDSLVPQAEHEDLELWQTLGLGEGDIAEQVEAAICGSGLRVGYRVHIPYVEVKLWHRRADWAQNQLTIDKVNRALAPWTAARGKTDFVDVLVRASFEGLVLLIHDEVTGGYVQNRLADRVAHHCKLHPNESSKGSLVVTTSLLPVNSARSRAPMAQSTTEFVLSIAQDASQKIWRIEVTGSEAQILAVEPTPLYSFGTDRGQKYMAEKVFQVLSTFAPFARFSESQL